MHVPPEGLLTAHSIAEAFLFAQLTFCPRCKRRPIRPAERLRATGAAHDPWILRVDCSGCRQSTELQFRIDPPPVDRLRPDRTINPTPRRSELIDIVGWTVLARGIVDGAETTKDAAEARDMLLEAGQCLNEALRFFGARGEAPPDDAFFSEQSRARQREHPEQFSRSAILALQERLPVASSAAPAARVKRPWWKFW